MGLTAGQFGAFIAAIARIGGMVATAPVIGDSGVSARAKLVFVLAAAFAVAANHPEVDQDALIPTMLVELAVGLATGASARFVFSRIAIAGQIMGFSLGLGFASQYDPHAGENAGTIRSLLTAVAGLAFIGAGGLEAIVRGAAAHPAQVTDLAGVIPQALADGTAAFGRGFAIAAPIVFASAVGNLGLAVMNRAAPAVNVFSVALPAVLVVGGLLLLGSANELVATTFDTARDAIARF